MAWMTENLQQYVILMLVLDRIDTNVVGPILEFVSTFSAFILF